jgi:hypothetical protein
VRETFDEQVLPSAFVPFPLQLEMNSGIGKFGTTIDQLSIDERNGTV